ncbi:Peptidoglycan/LPS O-acetylase OafA/YrhL, contains acyltransferase and SGNH-hydrolase domains [Prosthecobacter debontii]|uniref:Peptidoglycan/LPS O-acetylase OafA/YrhL, contains acyltransferase and SGNH-hydrolase domains n=1 Tax=Prosthecobacter debontii TaxID=48467 RepID=A0A1T4XT07_9BACT|nr:acyltransferase family protein [Prosthecobacter debontii]SKA92288.1 Peptidoglycan/LPS O-acetylase OafA/YrhL, contains acyltransferase and SGNH-hydrolase domains [Prosthecobacter debontii]
MSLPSSSSYRPDIDGLRGVAVMMVVLFHADFGFNGGYTGVDLFFVISGYLITGLLFKELDRGGIDLVSFWERRLRRIAPALLVMLLVTVGAGYFLLMPDAFSSLGESVIAQALFCANLYFWKDSGYFSSASEEKPLLHLWSLAVEEQFYVILPIVLILGHAWLKRRRGMSTTRRTLVRGLAWLWGVSFVASVVCVYRDANTAFYWLPPRAWELLTGSVLAGLPQTWLPRTKRIRHWIGSLSFVMIFVAGLAYEDETPFPGLAALLPCLGAAGLIWAHAPGENVPQGDRSWTWRLFTWRPLVGIGLISYSLYLWHWPLLALAHYLNVSKEGLAVGVRAALVVAAMLLAWASWKWVETPFRKKGLITSRRMVFGLGLGSIMTSLMIGVWLVRGQGLPERIPESALNYARGRDDRDLTASWTGLEAAQKGEFPQFGAEGRPVRLMLWGDSHARSLMPVLDRLCEENQVAGEMAIYSATSPTFGFYRRSRHGLNERTELLAEAVLARLKQTQASHVILAAYWMECSGKDSVRFENALVQTVQRLKEAGPQVWVVLDVPTQPYDVPKALALGGLWPSDAVAMSTSMEEYHVANKVMQSLIPRLKTAGAHVVEPMELLTGAKGRSRVEHGGHSLYIDSHHLSVTGALFLKPLFEPLFK